MMIIRGGKNYSCGSGNSSCACGCQGSSSIADNFSANGGIGYMSTTAASSANAHGDSPK